MKFEQYTTEPERVEAILVNADNVDIVARLVGGAVGDDQDHTADNGFTRYLRVPALGADLKVALGDYLIKNLATGRYESHTRQAFETKFHRMSGIRHDGLIPRNGKTDIVDPTIKREREPLPPYLSD